jgi:hypothetical protein
MVGAGGIISDPEGKMEATFVWGLRIPTNIESKASALLQGLTITKKSNIQSLITI